MEIVGELLKISSPCYMGNYRGNFENLFSLLAISVITSIYITGFLFFVIVYFIELAWNGELTIRITALNPGP